LRQKVTRVDSKQQRKTETLCVSVFCCTQVGRSKRERALFTLLLGFDDYFSLLSAKMCTFAHGYRFLFLQSKDNQKWLNSKQGIQP